MSAADDAWYAQILGISTRTSRPSIRQPQCIPPNPCDSCGFDGLALNPGIVRALRWPRLPKVGFLGVIDEVAFGFLAPDLVIRGSHLIPAFHSGRTCDLIPFDEPTIAHAIVEKDDWVNFYVNLYVSSVCVPVLASELLSAS